MKLYISNDGDVFIQTKFFFFMTVSTPYYPNSEWFIGGTTLRAFGKTFNFGY